MDNQYLPLLGFEKNRILWVNTHFNELQRFPDTFKLNTPVGICIVLQLLVKSKTEHTLGLVKKNWIDILVQRVNPDIKIAGLF